MPAFAAAACKGCCPAAMARAWQLGSLPQKAIRVASKAFLIVRYVHFQSSMPVMLATYLQCYEGECCRHNVLLSPDSWCGL